MITARFKASRKTIVIEQAQPTPFERIEIRLPGCSVNIEPHALTEGEIALDAEEFGLNSSPENFIKTDRFPVGFVPISARAYIQQYKIKES